MFCFFGKTTHNPEFSADILTRMTLELSIVSESTSRSFWIGCNIYEMARIGEKHSRAWNTSEKKMVSHGIE